MSERASYQIDEILVASVQPALDNVANLRPANANGGELWTGSKILLSEFTELHLDAFQHEYTYGSRLDICRSILEGVTKLYHRAVNHNDGAKIARYGALFSYADTAHQSVVKLIEPTQHERLRGLVQAGSINLNADDDGEEYSEHGALIDKGLVIVRQYGKKIEISPTSNGSRVSRCNQRAML